MNWDVRHSRVTGDYCDAYADGTAESAFGARDECPILLRWLLHRGGAGGYQFGDTPFLPGLRADTDTQQFDVANVTPGWLSRHWADHRGSFSLALLELVVGRA